MIVVERRGRLGNQMFQYAFGLAAARLLDTELVMEDEDLRALFVLDGRSEARPVETPELPVVTLSNEDYDEPEEVLAELEDGRQYSGFFQSERFFAAAAEEVRAAFRFRPEHEEAFRTRYADLLERPYVCCHVRRTDYETFAGGVVLPVSYYRKSLSRLAPGPDVPVVFVGDDLDEARTTFGTQNSARFEQNEEAVDLQLLVHADAAVVSNSTFAWWGAWLNARPQKRVLAPRYWVGFNHRTGWHNARQHETGRRRKRDWESPRRVIPPDWIQVPVQRRLQERLSPQTVRSSLALFANNALASLERH
jgi:hypothetical protein